MILRHYGLFAVAVGLGMFASMLAAIEAGARLSRRRREVAASGTAAIEGAVFALLGLLVALTFSGAADRINERVLSFSA